MAERKDMADTPSTVQESELAISVSKSINNNLLSTSDDKVDENLKVTSKDDKNETTPRNGIESDKSTSIDNHNNLLPQSSEESDESKVYEKVIALEEHNTLCKITCVLQETVINLLHQKIKLTVIKIQNFKNNVINAVNDVELRVKDALAIFFTESGVCKNTKLPKIQSIIEESTNETMVKEIAIDLEQIAKETQDTFSIYLKVFEKSKTILKEYFLQNIEKRLKMNVARNLLETQTAYFSILEDVTSHKSFLDSSIKAFEEFETLMKHFVEISTQDSESRIDLFLAAIHKAESSCTDLISFTSILLRFECAKV